MAKRVLTVIANYLLFTATGAMPYAVEQKIELSQEYLDACETGLGECKPIIIDRQKGARVTLQFPLLSRASVGLWDADNFERLQKRKPPYKSMESKISSAREQPLIFDLTKRVDGTYHLWLTSCGAGGFYEVRLRTK
jgi:hypothetical protein